MLLKAILSAAVFSAQVLSKSFESQVEYSVVSNSDTSSTQIWHPYADVNLSEIPTGTFSPEFTEGRVVGTIAGDLEPIAQKMWSSMTAESTVVLRLVRKNDDKLSTVFTTAMENITHLGKLFKALSAMEIILLFDSQDEFMASRINFPWDLIEDLPMSKKRLGTIIVQKPVKTSKVIEEDPSEVLKDLDAVDPAEPPPADPRSNKQSFLGKYWWAIAGGMVLMQVMGSDTSDRQQPGAAAPTGAGGTQQGANNNNNQQGPPATGGKKSKAQHA